MAYFRGHFHPDIGAAKKSDKMRHYYSRIGHRKGPPGLVVNCSPFPHDPPEIAGQSLGVNRPSFWPLIAAKDGLFPVPFPARRQGGENDIEMRDPYSRLSPKMRSFLVGGELVAISPRIHRKSRTNQWILTGPRSGPNRG